MRFCVALAVPVRENQGESSGMMTNAEELKQRREASTVTTILANSKKVVIKKHGKFQAYRRVQIQDMLMQ